MTRVLLSLGLCLAASALAQPGPATTSNLTRISLTGGAVRVTDAGATREFGRYLNTLAATERSGCVASEYLVWDDPDLAEQIVDDLGAGFARRGLEFEETDEEEDEESYSLSFRLTEKSNRYVGLLYMDDESIVLGWCRLKAPVAPGAQKPQAPAPASASTAAAGTGAPGGPLVGGAYSCWLKRPSLSGIRQDQPKGTLNLRTDGTYTYMERGGTYRYDPGTGVLRFTGGFFADDTNTTTFIRYETTAQLDIHWGYANDWSCGINL